MKFIKHHQKLPFIQQIFSIRALVTRLLKPKSGYFFFSPKRSTGPLSPAFGFDRGTPIDRYYIEQFLAEHAKDIKGKCLEIHDDMYIKKFGKNVTQADILDIDTDNPLATIYDDLRNLKSIKDNTYDCLIVTQTFGQIDQCQLAVAECWRILKPNGVILGSATSMGAIGHPEYTFWRFTVASIKYLFSTFFTASKLQVVSYGNVLSCQACIVGAAAEELSRQELDEKNEKFPLVIAFRAVKKA
jgi:hypothetical protein